MPWQDTTCADDLRPSNNEKLQVLRRKPTLRHEVIDIYRLYCGHLHLSADKMVSRYFVSFCTLCQDLNSLILQVIVVNVSNADLSHMSLPFCVPVCVSSSVCTGTWHLVWLLSLTLSRTGAFGGVSCRYVDDLMLWTTIVLICIALHALTLCGKGIAFRDQYKDDQ